jgi:DNA-3-methyladenine glycosylase I
MLVCMQTAKKDKISLHRCQWAQFSGFKDDPMYRDYHDTEWGVPLRDSRALFEYLLLDGAQAGLSWATILHKREGYRAAFDGFDAEKIARYGAADIERLMLDGRIVRNRRKIESFINNSKAFLRMVEQGTDFSPWLWNFVDGKPLVNHWKTMEQIPASTPLSDTVSKELKRRGFNFCGSTIVYAFMQAAGLVNDHVVSCFRWREVQETG